MPRGGRSDGDERSDSVALGAVEHRAPEGDIVCADAQVGDHDLPGRPLRRVSGEPAAHGPVELAPAAEVGAAVAVELSHVVGQQQGRAVGGLGADRRGVVERQGEDVSAQGLRIDAPPLAPIGMPVITTAAPSAASLALPAVRSLTSGACSSAQALSASRLELR